jgi:hypothetical protein
MRVYFEKPRTTIGWKAITRLRVAIEKKIKENIYKKKEKPKPKKKNYKEGKKAPHHFPAWAINSVLVM